VNPEGEFIPSRHPLVEKLVGAVPLLMYTSGYVVVPVPPVYGAPVMDTLGADAAPAAVATKPCAVKKLLHVTELEVVPATAGAVIVAAPDVEPSSVMTPEVVPATPTVRPPFTTRLPVPPLDPIPTCSVFPFVDCSDTVVN
jgi:hypothetical protein